MTLQKRDTGGEGKRERTKGKLYFSTLDDRSHGEKGGNERKGVTVCRQAARETLKKKKKLSSTPGRDWLTRIRGTWNPLNYSEKGGKLETQPPSKRKE